MRKYKAITEVTYFEYVNGKYVSKELKIGSIVHIHIYDFEDRIQAWIFIEGNDAPCRINYDEFKGNFEELEEDDD